MLQIHETKPGDFDYPLELLKQRKFPERLYYIGTPIWNGLRSLSIVGTRDPSESAIQWLERELALALKTSPFNVVSGGARGVDQLAHKIALRNRTPTTMFLPSGLNYPYPEYLQEWIRPIVECGGAVVSHLPCDARMEKRHFLTRNLWIASISHATLIVEAARKSGTIMTACCAKEIDKPLGVMPTLPESKGLGGLELLRDGAGCILDSDDILSLCKLGKVKS